MAPNLEESDMNMKTHDNDMKKEFYKKLKKEVRIANLLKDWAYWDNSKDEINMTKLSNEIKKSLVRVASKGNTVATVEVKKEKDPLDTGTYCCTFRICGEFLISGITIRAKFDWDTRSYKDDSCEEDLDCVCFKIIDAIGKALPFDRDNTWDWSEK